MTIFMAIDLAAPDTGVLKAYLGVIQSIVPIVNFDQVLSYAL